MPLNYVARHERMTYGDVKLYAGTGCAELSAKIAEYLELPRCERDIIVFPNDNLSVELPKAYTGKIVM